MFLTILFRLLLLILFSLAGGLLYALTVNIMIMGTDVDTSNLQSSFGYEMTSRAVMVWLGALLIGAMSVFVQSGWRYVLLSLPLLAPSLYAVLYMISLT